MKTGIFKNFLIFIRKPDYNELEDLTPLLKLKELIKLYFITILLAAIISLLNKAFISLGLYSQYSQNINRLPEILNKDIIKPYLIFGLFCPPILEEFAFRLLLTKFNKKLITISLSLIIGLVFYRLFNKHLWHSQSPIIINIVSYLYPVIFALPIYLILYLIKFDLKKLWNINFTFVFYLFTIMFALFHILTLNITNVHYYFLPIIILPFLLFSISLGYARIRFGILYSIVLHFIFNAPVIIRVMMTIN